MGEGIGHKRMRGVAAGTTHDISGGTTSREARHLGKHDYRRH